MMKPFTVSAVLALAFAGAACSQPSGETEPTPPEAAVIETAASEDDGFGGFNLMIPGDDDGGDEVGGFNLGVNENVTEDGFAIPDGVVEDRLSDVAELPTGDATVPDISAELPSVPEQPEDDVIRLD